MLKLVGSLLVILAGTGLGMNRSLVFTKREQTLEEIRKMVLLLKGELRFGGASLYEALTGTAEKMHGECRAFLLYTAKKIKDCGGEPFGRIFRDGVQNYFGKTGLTEEEMEKLCAAGEGLGYLDLEMQLKQLSLYEETLVLYLQEIKREFPAKRKMCRSLGILGGFFLAVLIW